MMSSQYFDFFSPRPQLNGTTEYCLPVPGETSTLNPLK